MKIKKLTKDELMVPKAGLEDKETETPVSNAPFVAWYDLSNTRNPFPWLRNCSKMCNTYCVANNSKSNSTMYASNKSVYGT